KTSPGGGYSKDRYLALFAGMIPASRPRLVTVVVIDEPRTGVYFGGEVAAPVFSSIMTEAVRLLDITPDDLRPGNPAPATGVRPVRLDSRGTL
ncbi:MAG: hypothetical protein LC799_16400, partial [Actinobacteria bacterium]|nr:hypothetical protein [Actinomycetota bacterium]